MAELEKTILPVPELPAVIRGDGRDALSIIRRYLKSMSEQVNLANGFTAEEIYLSTDVQTPKNFFLTFDRLGAQFTWDHIRNIDTLLYYELRTNENVGSDNGLLERTRETESTVIPVSFSADVYLYAVTTDGKVSAPAKISYTKMRPEEPEDLALTKNNEGTLITFLEIPSDCIGANVYVNGKKYVVYDNIFLYPTTESEQIKTVEVAYFDSFGEGQRAILSVYLPDVTRFMVERNGDSLDFYWDPINIYGIEYVVRLGIMPEWESAIEIFRTNLNKKKYICPKAGEYYLLIKAVDEHNNYSENAAWVSTINSSDINRNVILASNQQDTLYSDSKVNMYYDAVSESLKLDYGMFYGEYVARIELPQEYRARNWLDYQCISMAENHVIWDEAVFTWDSEEAETRRWSGVATDNNTLKIRTQIAKYQGKLSDDVVDNISLNNTLMTDRGALPTESESAVTFREGRWANGLFVDNSTRLSYTDQEIPQTFSVVLNVKVTEALRECAYLTIKTYTDLVWDNALSSWDDAEWSWDDAPQNDTAWLMLGHSQGEIFLRGSDGVYMKIPNVASERDWLTFGISQSDTHRTLHVHSLTHNKMYTVKAEARPIKAFDMLYLYPNADGIHDSQLENANAVLSDITLFSGKMEEKMFLDRINTPIGYGMFTDFYVGDYEYQKAILRLIVTTDSTDSVANLFNMVMNVDIPDTDDRGSVDIIDTTAPTKVHFNVHYYHPPEVSVTLKGGNTESGVLIPNLVSLDREDVDGRYFEAELLTITGERATGSFTWVSKGY